MHILRHCCYLFYRAGAVKYNAQPLSIFSDGSYAIIGGQHTAKSYEETAAQRASDSRCSVAALPANPWLGCVCTVFKTNTPQTILRTAAAQHNLEQKSSEASTVGELFGKCQQSARTLSSQGTCGYNTSFRKYVLLLILLTRFTAPRYNLPLFP